MIATEQSAEVVGTVIGTILGIFLIATAVGSALVLTVIGAVVIVKRRHRTRQAEDPYEVARAEWPTVVDQTELEPINADQYVSGPLTPPEGLGRIVNADSPEGQAMEAEANARAVAPPGLDPNDYDDGPTHVERPTGEGSGVEYVVLEADARAAAGPEPLVGPPTTADAMDPTPEPDELAHPARIRSEDRWKQVVKYLEAHQEEVDRQAPYLRVPDTPPYRPTDSPPETPPPTPPPTPPDLAPPSRLDRGLVVAATPSKVARLEKAIADAQEESDWAYLTIIGARGPDRG